MKIKKVKEGLQERDEGLMTQEKRSPSQTAVII